MILIIIISVLIIEIILASTWNPLYFRKGLLVYQKAYNVGAKEITIPDPELLNEKYSSSWKPSFVFKKISANELAYREKIFQLTFASYPPIVHANLCYDPITRKFKLKCFANLTIIALLVCFVYLALSDFQLFNFSRATIFADIGIFFTFFGFLAALVGGIAAYQIQQFKLVPKSIMDKA